MTSQVIQNFEKEEISRLSEGKNIPDFRPGDTVIVDVQIKEGNNTRIQAFEGVVIALERRGLNTSFTVRKVSHGESVERKFPLYSTNVKAIKIVRQGKVRRAKLYYMRTRFGKASRIKEKLYTK